MKLPKIGDTIGSNMALLLCEHFNLTYLVKRINDNPSIFRPWRFDGASMLPDGWWSRRFNIPNLTEIALRHDLKYAYGDLKNKKERLKADLEFTLELLADGASAWIAKTMLLAIIGGGSRWFRLSFTWGFARKKR